ncbi:MAG: HAD-IIIA family hydrolase [Candidatus Cloacimonetes bacterium]|nr:HAD-IIIA family hydrolase [Candidatus Cloacimonadota bacterium]
MKEKTKQGKAVFLDRDGTINADDAGFINKPEDLQLYPFAAQAITKLKKMGYLVFVVTNQAGVAYGYFTIEDVEKINTKMLKDLSEANAFVDDVLYAPYHAKGIVEPFNIQHEDRKPGIGMFKKINKKYGVNTKLSFMIGDRASDIGFGKNAGLKTILVRTGNGEKEFMDNRVDSEFYPDYVVKDLAVAVKLIEEIDK